MDAVSIIFFVMNVLFLAYPFFQIYFASKYALSFHIQVSCCLHPRSAVPSPDIACLLGQRACRRWSKWIDATREQVHLF